jgi:hypothetical protein
MPNISNRPYVGTWQNNMRQVVRHTPDAMVFLNGDVSIPGCERCRGRIDIQRYITNISVDAGVLPGSLSASISMSTPRISGEQFFVDGHNKIFPGLEVHIYMRGYFPIKGMYQSVAPQEEESKFTLREGQDIPWADLPSYPYYPVFHGVVTNVSYNYDGGEYHADLSCASLLHFWQYHNMATNGAYFGSRPNNSAVKMSMTGNQYNNMHPFELMYTLYRTVAGVPGGIAFALDEQSNLDAPLDTVGSDGQNSAWSQILRYWEKRFSSRIQNLRMYGVNGNLFNAAQQAFIGSRNHGITSGELQNVIKNSQYGEDGTLRPKREFLSGNLAIAKALGFDRTGFDFTYTAQLNPDASGSFEEGDQASLSILDMFAYTQNMSDLGSTNLWESTYETKLQIAEQVMEVTGYEFYQDVDGDLVFKPPFYNLDTKHNRVYRIEDIDIISITFQEKEPEATWISVKLSWTKNLTGAVSTDGVMNKRAVYVDWKLVGQFGWRPANIDITYTVNTRSASYIGMSRLDLLNVDVHSAQVTIPIRPELKPGYPVYLPGFDCFFYISQLAHGHTFGSQCTTSLTLTARRRKFFAPGVQDKLQAGQDINDFIRLDRMDLPARPIQVHDNGIPRLAGFPNVVLALDPTRMNPKMLPVGAGVEHLDATTDYSLFESLIREDIKSLTPSVFQIVPVSQDPEATSADQVEGEEVRYRLQLVEDRFLVFTLRDIQASFNDLQNARKEVDRARRDIEEKRNAIFAEGQTQGSWGRRGPPATTNAALANLEDELFKAQVAEKQATEQNQRGEIRDAAGGLIEKDEGAPNPNLFLRITEIVRQSKNDPARRKVDDIPGGDVTANYLDLLDNLKSQYNSNGLPGYYRYYSASHADPAQQGQPAAVFTDKRRRKRVSDAQSPPDTGGAAPSSGSPAPGQADPAQPVDVNVDPVNTDGLSELEALQAKLDAAGVTFISARQLLSFRNQGGDQKRRNAAGVEFGRVTEIRDEKGKLIGYEPVPGTAGPLTKEEYKNLPFSEEQSNNMANVVAAGQELARRWTANPGSKELREQKSGRLTVSGAGAWRPYSAVEGSGGISQHAEGRAIDIPIRPQYASIKGDAALEKAWSDAFQALCTEAQKMWQEGLIGGVGFYPQSGFVHIDIRSKASTWMQWVDPGAGGRNVSASRTCGLKEGPTPTKTPSSKNQSPCAWLGNLYNESGYAGYAAVVANRRNRIRPFPAKGKKEAPKAAPPPPPEPPPPPPPPPPEPPSVDAPPVALFSIDLPEPKEVAGFIPPTIDDPFIRPPEADLGIITATKGFVVAQGPGQDPRILSSDQIQTVSFTQFRMEKNFSISSWSTDGGEFFFKKQEFKRFIARRFFNDAQFFGISPASTPVDLFQATWDDINEQIQKAPLPVYDNGVKKEEEAIVLESFTDVSKINVSDDPDEIVFEDISDLPLATLKSFQTFSGTGPTKQGKAGQNFSLTLRKLSEFYAEYIANLFENQFSAKQVLAFNPGKDRQARLSDVTSSMDVAAILALNDTAGDFKSTQRGGKLDKVQKFAKIGSPIHSLIKPISDGDGYEHFGAYRYGRGLTVEKGGSFAFVHDGGDPLGQISAPTAEIFLETLTQIKGGAKRRDKDLVKSRQADLERLTQEIIEEESVEEPVIPDGFTPEQRQQAEEAFRAEVRQRAELRLVFSILNATPKGQEALEELLSTNGDDPNLVEGELGRTQLEDNFVNQAANYAKSPVFKTNVANAAYRLTDLTAHINDPSLSACSCKGSMSDVQLAAFGRIQFVSVDGLSAEEEPAESFVAEQMLNESVDFFYQQKALRGEVLDPNQTPNAGSFEGVKNMIGTSLANARTGFTSTGEQFSNVPEQFRELGREFGDAFGG